MKYLFKNLLIYFPQSPYHNKNYDLLIEDGCPIAIQEEINIEENEVQRIDFDEAILAPGFVDSYCNIGQPGQEHKEELTTAVAAALKGGFTNLLLAPDNIPSTDNSNLIESITKISQPLPIRLHPIGAITKNLKEELFSEVLDLSSKGVTCFSNGQHPLQSNVFLLKALQYLKSANKVLIQTPYYKDLTNLGEINEGEVSAKLGLRGIPAIAEEMMVARDIQICEYIDSPIHFNAISTEISLNYIVKAKEKGLKITCGVNPVHLCFTEKNIEEYNNLFKILPPLRTVKDVRALREGVRNGLIDCISSNHYPYSIDEKNCDFSSAKFGLNSLEFSALVGLDLLQNDLLGRFVDLYCINPRKIFNIPIPTLSLNQPLEATIFSFKESSFMTNSLSKMKTSPFLNKLFKGQIKGTINKNFVNLPGY